MLVSLVLCGHGSRIWPWDGAARPVSTSSPFLLRHSLPVATETEQAALSVREFKDFIRTDSAVSSANSSSQPGPCWPEHVSSLRDGTHLEQQAKEILMNNQPASGIGV